MDQNEELKEKIIAELKKIFDPEIPINIYDLGFIYDIGIDNGKVHILMTLTVPGCPIHHILTRQIKEQLSRLDGIEEVDVELTFEPRWSVEKITEDGKARLRELGYNV
ncbi:hypothetical protein DRQ26_03790 [bacterium]|nr:MAG: hypothetical protein DRQ26_03790 [bacterium]